jgi:hypothetical protein
MNPSPSPTVGRGIALAVLIVTGRFTLAVALAYGLAHMVWGYPADIRRILWGLAAAAAMLVAAAWLVKDLAWLLHVVVWAVAVACLLIVGAVVSAYFHRAPHALRAPELNVAVAALGVLALSYVFLRRGTKKRKHG